MSTAHKRLQESGFEVATLESSKDADYSNPQLRIQLGKRALSRMAYHGESEEFSGPRGEEGSQEPFHPAAVGVGAWLNRLCSDS